MNYYRRGDIVKFNTPIIKGSGVQGGYRPWVVVSNKYNNRYSGCVIVVPLTTNMSHCDLPTHTRINGKGLKPCVAKCEQVRVIDVRNDWEYVCRLPRKAMKRVDKALANAFFYGEGDNE